MAMQPKRRSPDGAASRGRKPQRQHSRALRWLMASGALIGRHPRALGGLVAFGVIFSFVAANALWYQPRRHPAPFLATRAGVDQKRGVGDDMVQAVEPGVTVFRIERQSDEKPADKPKPSELVRQIQAGLAARGLYDGPADGLTGPRTEAAILFFEQTEGMAETGAPSREILDRLNVVATAATDTGESDEEIRTASTKTVPDDEVAALIQASEAPAAVIPAEKPASPALVMKIQKALAGMAYADVKVDGIAGEATRTAIRAFEKSYRLPVTGEPSERVLRKLKSIGAI